MMTPQQAMTAPDAPLDDRLRGVYGRLHGLGENEEARLEERILRLLGGNPLRISARDVYRALGAPRKLVAEALKALVARR